MPYDQNVENVLEQLKDARDAYHSALRLAAEQVRGYLAACREGSEGLAGRAAKELGEFGRGRIDPERFANLFLTKTTPPTKSVRAVERALKVLESLDTRGNELFVFTVEPGGDLRSVVDEALAQAGRAFGVARIVDLVRSGRYEAEKHDSLLDRLPFRSWNRAERRLAPPLVIQIEGADLFASSLGEYLDGMVKIFLLVNGPAAPAPLARLITPGTFIIQTTDIIDLGAAVSSSSPTIAAVLPEGSATFVHDPAAGSQVWERLTVTSKPDREPKRAIGGVSAAQQAEELRLLAQLSEKATAPVTVPAAAPGAPAKATPAEATDPVDRLAAWLLQQAQ